MRLLSGAELGGGSALLGPGGEPGDRTDADLAASDLRSEARATQMASLEPYAIIDSMAQLIVRNIEDEVVEALKLRAAQHGRSAEAEHRELLRSALLRRPSTSLKEHLLAMPDVGEDVDLVPPRDTARRVDL